MVSVRKFSLETLHTINSTVLFSRRWSGILTLLVYAFSSFSLPVRLTPEAFLQGRTAAMPGAMTVGCAEASCCTSRCYLDEHGVHHCVPANGRSCDCGLSSGDTPGGTPAMGDEALIAAPERPMRDSSFALFDCEVSPGPQSALLLPSAPPPKS